MAYDNDVLIEALMRSYPVLPHRLWSSSGGPCWAVTCYSDAPQWRANGRTRALILCSPLQAVELFQWARAYAAALGVVNERLSQAVAAVASAPGAPEASQGAATLVLLGASVLESFRERYLHEVYCRVESCTVSYCIVQWSSTRSRAITLLCSLALLCMKLFVSCSCAPSCLRLLYAALLSTAQAVVWGQGQSDSPIVF